MGKKVVHTHKKTLQYPEKPLQRANKGLQPL